MRAKYAVYFNLEQLNLKRTVIWIMTEYDLSILLGTPNERKGRIWRLVLVAWHACKPCSLATGRYANTTRISFIAKTAISKPPPTNQNDVTVSLRR